MSSANSDISEINTTSRAVQFFI